MSSGTLDELVRSELGDEAMLCSLLAAPWQRVFDCAQVRSTALTPFKATATQGGWWRVHMQT